MVDPELFERYQKALGTNADLCKKAVEALLSKLEGLTPLEQAEYLLANYPKLVQAYGRAAADVARQFYQEQRDRHFEGDDDASEYTAQTAAPIQESWAYEDVQKAASDGIGYLLKVAVRRVMQRADQTIAYNVGHDPARPRWAIVPHMGACGWCVMVASNGWAYSERSVNAQRHDGCKCSVAVDFDRDSPLLAGYDPDELRRQYARGIDDAGGEEGIRAKWDALSSEEQAKYRRKGRSAYDVFKTRQVANAMDARTRRNELDARVFELARADAKNRFGVEGARKLADAFNASMSARKSWFLDQITQERYDEAIGSFLADVGRVYGMNISGEFSSGPKLYSALPDGDEIWALTRMGELFKTAQFLSTDRRRRKGNPDLLVDGEYIDIKTPKRVRRVGERLNDAATQCRNRGQDAGIAILSTLRLDEGAERCAGFAQAKIESGKVDRVYLVWQNSSVDVIQ